MTPFILTHPVISFIVFLILSLNLVAISALMVGIYKEKLRQRIRRQGKRIVDLLADITEIEKYTRKIEELYINLLEETELRKKIKIVVSDQDIETSVKAFNKGNKDFPLIHYKEPKIDLQQIEDMTSELNRMLKDNKIIIENYPKIVEHNHELKRSFDKHTEYSKMIEQANKDLHKMYESVLVENMELKDPAKRLQETIEHKKHATKAVESDWWTPKRNIEELFIEGVAYRVREDVNVGVNLLRLWSGNKSYTVQKSDFMPCNNRGIHVKEHTLNPCTVEKLN